MAEEIETAERIEVFATAVIEEFCFNGHVFRVEGPGLAPDRIVWKGRAGKVVPSDGRTVRQPVGMKDCLMRIPYFDRLRELCGAPHITAPICQGTNS